MNISPAYLFIGPHYTLEKEAIHFLQKKTCQNNGCQKCIICKQLQEKQHHSAIWIAPEKRYSIDNLEIIFKTTTLQLDKEQHTFFIITKADFLNATCANSLLKLVEEPPVGYHFIFLAEFFSQVLPTIRSRCVHHYFRSEQLTQTEIPPVVKAFMTLESNPIEFSKAVTYCSMTEQDCMIWVDFLLNYWIESYKKQSLAQQISQQKASLSMVNLLKKQLINPPGMGSSKLFWKNLYLQK